MNRNMDERYHVKRVAVVVLKTGLGVTQTQSASEMRGLERVAW